MENELELKTCTGYLDLLTCSGCLAMIDEDFDHRRCECERLIAAALCQKQVAQGIIADILDTFLDALCAGDIENPLKACPEGPTDGGDKRPDPADRLGFRPNWKDDLRLAIDNFAALKLPDQTPESWADMARRSQSAAAGILKGVPTYTPLSPFESSAVKLLHWVRQHPIQNDQLFMESLRDWAKDIQTLDK